jgi:hypothetical protein
MDKVKKKNINFSHNDEVHYAKVTLTPRLIFRACVSFVTTRRAELN